MTSRDPGQTRVFPIRSEAENSWTCYLETIANYWIVTVL